VSTSPLTRVLSVDHPGRAIAVLGFGIPFSEDRVTDTAGTQIVRLFRPGSVFAMVWWRSLSHRRQHRTLAILEAPGIRGDGDAVPQIQPRAISHVFMDQYGPAGKERSVDLMLDLIQDMRNQEIEPAHVAAKYWRCAAQRIMMGEQAPDFADGDYPSHEGRA